MNCLNINDFYNEYIIKLDNKPFKRIDYFNNKTLNKYIEVYNLSHFKNIVAIKINSKSESIKLNAFNSLNLNGYDYVILIKEFLSFPKELILYNIYNVINGFYYDIFSKCNINKYKISYKEIDFKDIKLKWFC